MRAAYAYPTDSDITCTQVDAFISRLTGCASAQMALLSLPLNSYTTLLVVFPRRRTLLVAGIALLSESIRFTGRCPHWKSTCGGSTKASIGEVRKTVLRPVGVDTRRYNRSTRRGGRPKAGKDVRFSRHFPHMKCLCRALCSSCGDMAASAMQMLPSARVQVHAYKGLASKPTLVLPVRQATYSHVSMS